MHKHEFWVRALHLELLVIFSYRYNIRGKRRVYTSIRSRIRIRIWITIHMGEVV